MSRPPANILKLQSIVDLVGPPQRFRVENYQRGYKWDRRQVKDLLDDANDFRRKSADDPTRSEFYCLQPVVVKWRDDHQAWELIDGQQRLTTIYLILSHLGQAHFEIDYQTREQSGDFLRSLALHGARQYAFGSERIAQAPAECDNVDNHHFVEACKAIKEWFDGHSDADAAALHATLLRRTQVIWYEVRDETEPRAIFLRLNSGKIELTPAELIKALFLRGNPGKDSVEDQPLRQAEIAAEWDRIEAALQDEGFWYFIHRQPGKNAPSTRIEFLFDLVSGKTERDDDRHSFRHFETAVKAGVDKAWQEVSRRFEFLREWHYDHALFHRVGFLLTRGPAGTLKELLAEALKTGKAAFVQHVTRQITKRVNKTPLKELAYGEDNETLKDVLLLFNIESLIASCSNARFPFDRFKKMQWSLEHIHAQSSEALADQQEREEWYGYHRDLLQDILARHADSSAATELLTKLTAWHDNGPPADTTAARELEEEIGQLIAEHERGGDDNSMHGIGNLALLERGANSALSNAIFRDKRWLVIGMDKQGEEFVPPATKNVFLKYYTAKPKQMLRWDSTDRLSYREAIVATLKTYGVCYEVQS